MAAPSGNSSLLAGLGAFAVVVGGLAAYKHFKGEPRESSRVPTSIPEPDYQPDQIAEVDAAPSAPPTSMKTFVDNELDRAFALLGKTEAEVRATFPSQVLQNTDELDSRSALFGAKLVAWSTFIDDDYADAGIGFYVSDGLVTKVVSSVTRASERNSLGLIKQADIRWEPGALERSSAGLGLRYFTKEASIFAAHHVAENQWIFTAAPRSGTGEGTLGLGNYHTANCDVVGRTPHHLGAGKAYTFGQSEAAVLAIANRAEPDDSHEFYEDSLALFSGLADVDLVLSTHDKKLQSMTYSLTDRRAEEVTACWSRPALSLDDATYWKVGNERYRLSGTTLEIARVERMQDLIAELKASLDQPFGKVVKTAARYRVTGVPDWSLAIDVNQQSSADIADDEMVTSFEVYVGFYGASSQRDHLLQDIERGTGLAKLVRNDNNVPVLRAKLGQALFETEMYSATDLVIHVSPAAHR